MIVIFINNYTYKIFGLTEIEKKDDSQELNDIMKILLEIRKKSKEKEFFEYYL